MGFLFLKFFFRWMFMAVSFLCVSAFILSLAGYDPTKFPLLYLVLIIAAGILAFIGRNE